MPYPFQRIAVGRTEETYHPDTLRCALAEFISTLIFVFAGEGSVIAFAKLTGDGSTTPAGLVAEALAHGIGLFIGVAVSFNISGGHVNPAVTFGAFVGGHITLIRGIYYWIAQLLGATVAAGLLKYTTNGMTIDVFGLSSGVGVGNALVFEIVMTFGLVYTVYATAIDPNRNTLQTISPICIGFIVGANILAGGAFDGACMNPARAFGPALVSWTWLHHWIYWVGPLIGGGIAAAVFEQFFIEAEPTHERLPTSE